VPSRPDDPAHDANVAAWAGLAAFTRPFLCAFSDGDPITKGADRALKERIAGAQGQPHTTIAGGGHFLQEDRGKELAEVVVSFVTATS
jgi:haloalkane dehalogenase